jgi:hypothetical protein
MAISWNAARSIVILLALVFHEASYISCSCLRAWNISCSASASVCSWGLDWGDGGGVLVKMFLSVIGASWWGFGVSRLAWRVLNGDTRFE